MTLLKLFEAFKTYCDLFWGFFILDVRQLYPYRSVCSCRFSIPLYCIPLCWLSRYLCFFGTALAGHFDREGFCFPFHFCSLSVVEPSWAFVLSSIANRPLLCVLEQRVMYQRVKSVPPSPPNVPPSRFIPLLPAAYHLWRIYKAVWLCFFPCHFPNICSCSVKDL